MFRLQPDHEKVLSEFLSGLYQILKDATLGDILALTLSIYTIRYALSQFWELRDFMHEANDDFLLKTRSRAAAASILGGASLFGLYSAVKVIEGDPLPLGYVGATIVTATAGKMAYDCASYINSHELRIGIRRTR